ncbi:MAG TPA: hypothetical protein VF432_22155 [Thermoanaerobaculia bacterium]
MNLRSTAGLWCVLVLFLATTAAAQTLTYEPLVTGTTMSKLVVGPDGDVYAASGSTIRRVTPSGSSSVYVGTGTSGYLDGPRTTAQLSYVGSMAFDAEGRLLFSDSGNHVVRRVEADDTVTTIAGTPQTSGFVNGPALSARFSFPYGLAVAGDGSLYITDSNNSAIRKLATDGTVSTFAGGTYGSTNGTGTAARFMSPVSIAMDASGDFYVAESSGQTIRKVTSAAVVTTVAGATNAINYINGPALSARFGYPHSIAMMADGTLLIADEYYALRALKNGTVTAIGGDGLNSGNRAGTGTYARFRMPTGLAASGGVAYLTDQNGVLWRGGPSLPDRPAVDLNPAPYLQERQLSVTAQSATTFEWSLLAKPTGSQVTLQSNSATPTITPDYNGTYSILFVARSAAGSTIAPLDLVATCTEAPTPNITSDTQTSCPGNPVTLDAGPGYDEYHWSTGATTRTITVNPTFDASYSVTGVVGTCVSASDSHFQDVYRGATQVSVSTSGSMGICGNNTSSWIEAFPTVGSFGSSGDVAGYQWGYRTTAGGPITPLAGETNKRYYLSFDDFPAGGQYRIVCVVTPPCGAANIISPETVVTVRPALTVAFTPTQAYYCMTSPGVGTPVNISAQASGGNGGPYTYHWRKNGFAYRSDFMLTGPSTVTTDGGVWSVRVLTAEGCEIHVSVPVTSYVTPNTPSITTSAKVCAGATRTLSVDNPYYSGVHYLWSNGATGTQISVTQPGTYSVTRIDDVSGCSSTSSNYVIDFYAPPPVPNITASGPTTFCQGGSVTLTSDPGSGYYWSNGATTQSITVSTPGTYSVSVRNANNCSTSSAPVTVAVNPLPDATVTPSGPTTFCQGGSVTLTAPAGLTYLWSNGATTQSIDATASGAYSVTVTNANGCSKTSAATNVTVNSLPSTIISRSGPTTFCQGGSVTLTAPAGNTYLWSNGATSRSITVNASGTYSVTVTNPSGCSAESLPEVVTVNPLPDATVTPSGPTTFCAGGSVTLTAPAGNTYLWSNGATTQSITVSASGSYGVTVTNANGCSTASAPATVAVNPLPDATVTASGPTAFCAGGSVTLSAPAGLSYLWSNGATTQSIAVSAPGSYGVTVTNANGCSATSAPTTVAVHALPEATVTADGPTTFCEGGSVTLSAPEGLSYLWSNGATTQSIAVSASGSYSVTVTNANGCSTTSSATAVAVNALPDATVTADGPTTFCEGGSVTLSAPDGLSYAWSNGATTRSITVFASGSYSVTVTNGNGCSATSSPAVVTVDALPEATVTASGPTTFCEGGSVTLSAPEGLSYLWSNGATTQSISVSASGSYSVTVTNGSGCSATSAATDVTVNALPSATIAASGPTTFCEGGSVTLTASSGSSWLWSTGATTQSITVSAGGSYSVTVTNGNGCSASASTDVTVNALPDATVTASGPTTFCEGGNVTLSAPAGLSYLWSNGATTQSITVSAAGSYSVTVTNGNGCSATSPATAVTVNALPDATVTASGPTTFCEGGNVTLTAPAGLSYLWSNGATTQSIVVTASGSYSVTVTNGNGCSATSSATSVTVNALPDATVTASGPTTFCEGGSVTLTAPAGLSYLWSNGATTQSITVSASGSYGVTVTNGNGCSATSSATSVTVNALPDAGVTASGPTTFCEGGSVTLSAPAGQSYLWSNGATTQSISVNAAGSYSVTVTNGNGCSTTSAATAVAVNALPDATVTASGPTTFCEGGSVTLSAPAGQSYLWSNGATTQSITVSASGSYSVTVTNGNGCSATSSATSVTVNALPDATVTASGPTTFCEGGSVTLSAPAGQSYLWSNGATTQSIVVTAAGSYSVTVTNGNGCSATSAATNVTVNALPSPTITAGGPTTFCEGGSVTLTASNGTSWLWSNGATTQSISVNAAGSYSVIVTNANGCSATSPATSVSVNALPDTTVTASDPTTFCEGGSVTLSAPAGQSYLWSNGATTQSIVVTAAGSYSVTVTNGNGCSATSAATNVTVNALPSATITAGGPTTFCQGGSVTLTASNGTSWLWSNGATTQSISVNAAGSYSVTVTNGNGCSATSAATNVTVNPLPAATITAGGPTTFCEGGNVTLTASNGTSWLWSNGATTQSISVNAAGSYSVTVTNGNGCSTTSAATNVTVNALPSAAITANGPTTFCEGGSVMLTASSGTSWLWSNGATTQSITVNAAGSYSVTVTNENGCSATSAATNVTVNPLPAATITAGGPTTFCQGGSVTLTASNGTSWLWSNGATTQSITVNAAGSYGVTVTNGNGCSATSAATNVTVNALPTATITAGGPTTFCQGGSVTLTASNGTSWLWSNGATTQSISVNAAGSYSVTVTNGNGCSATSAATNVTVNALPSATITANGPTTFCEGGSVTLTASSGTSWLWSNGATTQSISVNAAGSYSVTVTNGNGCSATSAATNVTVNPLPAVPAITADGPTTFCAGGSVTLSAPAGFTYLWSNGATTQSIVASAGGSYSVTVTNANGCSRTSAATSVTVTPATAITQQPQSQTIPRNTAASLSVIATGSGTLTYQWYRGTSGTTSDPISGATASSYNTSRLGKGTYRYWVRVTGSCGSVNSATATITVP